MNNSKILISSPQMMGSEPMFDKHPFDTNWITSEGFNLNDEDKRRISTVIFKLFH